MIRKRCFLAILTCALGMIGGTSRASLSLNYQFNGTGNWSVDAVGGNDTPIGMLHAVVPLGSTVVKAFLYTSLYEDTGTQLNSVNFDGTTISRSSFTPLGLLTEADDLQAYRTDVTEQVAAKVGAGSATPFIFQVLSENVNDNIDGEVLAIVYSNPTGPVRTIALFDGSTNPAGDGFGLTFAAPLPNTTTANFQALFSLGIGFGYQAPSDKSQYSTVKINGRLLTSAAGGSDDGVADNGGLITVGGYGDDPANPISPSALPTGDPRDDDELYDLAKGNRVSKLPFLKMGDTQLMVNTSNPSFNDNIFFAGINVTAVATTTGTFSGPPSISVEQPAGTTLTSGSSTVDFGSVGVGGSYQLTFTVSNHGTGNLANLAVSVTGNNASEFNPASLGSTTVAPNSSTTFSIILTPADVGTRSAILHVTSDDPLTPSFDINLTGIGVPLVASDPSGTYIGLIGTITNDLLGGADGLITITLGQTKQFTGKLIFGNVAQSFKGGFDSNGNFSHIIGSLRIPLTLHLELIGTGPNAGGYVINGIAPPAALAAYHIAYGKSDSIAEAGNYTVLLNPTETGSTRPQGTGYATMTVSGSGGGVTMIGKMADGTPFTSAGPLVIDANGHRQFIVFNQHVYNNGGTLAGALTFEPLSISDCDGSLSIAKPQRHTAYYPSRYETLFTLMGARYLAPAAGQPALDFNGDARAELSGGSLSNPIDQTVTFTSSNTIVFNGSNTEQLKFSVNASTGIFSGSFIHPLSHHLTPFGGVLYQNPNAIQAGGFFLGPVLNGSGYSGKLSLTPFGQ